MGEAGHDLVQGIATLRLPLSVAKTVVVASSRAFSDQLNKAWKELGFTCKHSARNFGTEATAGRRRAIAIADGRIKRANARPKRSIRLR
jgi:hypothetical protein